MGMSIEYSFDGWTSGGSVRAPLFHTSHSLPTNEQIIFCRLFHSCRRRCCLPTRPVYVRFFFAKLPNPLKRRRIRGARKKCAGKATKKRNSCSNESVCARPSIATPSNDNNVNEWLRIPGGSRAASNGRGKLWIRRKTFSMQNANKNNETKKTGGKKCVVKRWGAISIVMVFCKWLVCQLIIIWIVASRRE